MGARKWIGVRYLIWRHWFREINTRHNKTKAMDPSPSGSDIPISDLNGKYRSDMTY